MRRSLQILSVLVLFLISCQAKKSAKDNVKTKKEISFEDSTDQAIFNSFKEIAKENALDSLALDARVIEVAKMFMQTPYVGGTLESDGKEKLVVNFRELDCTTYLENVVALSKIMQKDNFQDADFLKELEHLRYRNGKLSDYASRLHYFSDWIYENEKKGIVENITARIGGVKYDKTINFMSTHIASYPALKADTSLVKQIQQTEKQINQRNLYYIPEEKIQSIEEKIQNGDLIAITTKIKGLDISHVGIAIKMQNRLHLMNASSRAHKVVISDLPLAEMLQKSKLQSGIMVVRLR
ncbi:N-acetylmuramoyl-L-alanine amidase-like domain-containing protein [Ancylomarina longa]|uniref:DUF1460 domain-containing protein n=1 Tax=Ancylomarina longa TaxID=2487017 RepID=A0A434AFE0_9BACT|nr:N-acetylmuramoyl-L-alanine amidase-like domain-containing protein [Ancylomarina longa]RUT73096.1 DUF1460 domain-containing protein [Ancylomarina longa]